MKTRSNLQGARLALVVEIAIGMDIYSTMVISAFFDTHLDSSKVSVKETLR